MKVHAICNYSTIQRIIKIWYMSRLKHRQVQPSIKTLKTRPLSALITHTQTHTQFFWFDLIYFVH